MAKHEGLKVIGSVGDDKKLDFIEKELGFDGGFNYKNEKPANALKRLAPKGVDIYYDNVGGEQLEAAINAMNNHGRIGTSRLVVLQLSMPILTARSGVRPDFAVQPEAERALSD